MYFKCTKLCRSDKDQKRFTKHKIKIFGQHNLVFRVLYSVYKLFIVKLYIVKPYHYGTIVRDRWTFATKLRSGYIICVRVYFLGLHSINSTDLHQFLQTIQIRILNMKCQIRITTQIELSGILSSAANYAEQLYSPNVIRDAVSFLALLSWKKQ